MNDVTLGKTLDATARKDAIHIAIAPVIAGFRLSPGEHVGFVEDGNCEKVGVCKNPIGIVDPFLKADVEKGQRFYLFLYQNTVTSLRHEWVHPAFEAVEQSLAGESRRWITAFAEQYGCTFQDMMDAADDYEREEEYFCRGGTFEGEYVPDEFWQHYQFATGKIAKRQGNFFSCSC